ncbi:hypothetical protein [Pseudomonas entomophila]|uniref:hypothetical protein n=1 Tax=Pseudomonas entomophila TaxID=312306 RepID=UPI001F01E1CF|nr:hypothetical protein [Pseudomonas entomophila]MCG8291491.1 hypothetical protein [Pseudomonas entomophila]
MPCTLYTSRCQPFIQAATDRPGGLELSINDLRTTLNLETQGPLQRFLQKLLNFFGLSQTHPGCAKLTGLIQGLSAEQQISNFLSLKSDSCVHNKDCFSMGYSEGTVHLAIQTPELALQVSIDLSPFLQLHSDQSDEELIQRHELDIELRSLFYDESVDEAAVLNFFARHPDWCGIDNSAVKLIQI